MMDEIKLVKYLSGELEQEEIKEVEQWLEISENKIEFQKISQLWENAINLKDKELFRSEKSWTGMKQRMDMLHKREKHQINLLIYRYAAAASLILLLGFAGYFYFQGKNSTKVIQYTAGNVKQEKPVKLPDGTTVFLNRNTSLTYNKNFNKSSREVILVGEAYFDVAKNHNKPFIIHTPSAKIKVVGTSFNVLAYANSDSVQVLVQSGVVEMYSGIDNESKIMLTVGNEGTYLKTDKKLLTRKSFDSNMLAWKTNKLNFKNADMTYVTSALKHAFGKEIKFEDNRFKNCRLTVNFNNQSLKTILNVIKETLGISVIDQGDIYVLSGPGC